MAFKWKCSARSPPLLEHESVVSNVVEISTVTGHELEFDAEVRLVLCHSAPGLQGYELVIKRLIDKESNEWEELDGTEDLQCLEDLEDDYPSSQDTPDFFFPVAQADITECSTYAVVCRLKSSPTYTITSTGGSFSHPDYPGVIVTVPKKAVAPKVKFPLELKVQEVPSEEFEGQDVLIGPLLRVACSQHVDFFKPVTIQLPVSLQSEHEGIPDPSTCRLRVLFLRSDGADKVWIDITDELRSPVNFDGIFVTFQVERFSGYACVFEWRQEAFSVSGIISYLSSLIWNQPILGNFFAYFNPSDRAHSQDVLHLICCPAHMQKEIMQQLDNMVVTEANSRKKMIPGHVKAFVFVSGGIRPIDKEEVGKFHLMFENERHKNQLEVRLISDKELSRVEFRSTPDPEADNLLSKLSFRLSSLQLDSTKTPVEFFGVPLNDELLLDADPFYVLLACRNFVPPNTYKEHFHYLNKEKREETQVLRGFLEVIAGLDLEDQDKCFESIVNGLRSESEEGFSHVIKRLQEGREQVNIPLKKKPVVIQKVSERVGSSWKKLARMLEFINAQIKNIEQEEREDEDRCNEVLCTWCEHKGTDATIRKLMFALTKIGKAEVNIDIIRCLGLVKHPSDPRTPSPVLAE